MELIERLQAALGAAYTIERELGGGGMSRVFIAADRALSRRVVIKVLSPELGSDVWARRFEREIRLAASLQQANIVPVLHAGTIDDVAYYTMPFVEGRSLRERLQEGERPTLPETIGVLRDVARALAYAHERGVAHRDIKPENVLLSGGAAVVTDFGIAKAISAASVGGSQDHHASTTLTQGGVAIGTPAYMSPEQITADPQIDHRTDLYSFGCMAYELLAGRTPFADRGTPKLIAAHLTGAPVPLGELCPSCPPALVQLVMQCLEKDPPRRPQSALEILRGLDTMSISTSAFTRIRNRLSRRQRVGALALAGVVVAAAAAVFGRAFGGDEGAADTQASIGVLPFVNVGSDTGRNVWADGLTDEITTVLSRVPRLRLATRTSVERFRGQRNVDALQAGHTLQVRYVLHGTLWPAGDRVLVQAWLARTADGVDVWNNKFELGARDILATLDSLTRGITLAVQRGVLGRLSPSVAMAPGLLRGTSDTVAYELYLRGEVLLHSRGNGVPRAVQLFEQAIARDSSFARAHAALSDALAILPNFVDSTNQEIAPRATAAARRALALDPTLAEAQTSLALISMAQFRWAESDSEFHLALALDPNDAYAHMQYGRYLNYVGRFTDATSEMRRARTLDPTSSVIGGWLAIDLLLVGRKAEAFTEIDRALELDSTSVPVSLMGAQLALARGQTARARALAEIAWRPNGIPRTAGWLAGAAEVYRALGEDKMVRLIVQQIDSMPMRRTGGHTMRASLALTQGDATRALDELDLATNAGEFWLGAADFWARSPVPGNPAYEALHKSARFAALLRRVNLNASQFTNPAAERPR